MVYASLGKKPLWTESSNQTGFNDETIRSFKNQYNKTGKLCSKRGRPKTILQEEIYGIVGAVDSNCQTTLKEISKDFYHAKSTVKAILNENDIFHFQKTPSCLIDNDHKENRLSFCNLFTTISNDKMPIIIFTDESSICIDPGRKGVWRRP